MASNYTSNYQLCQWAAGDKVLRTEFNSDNAKIDAAVKAVDARVDSLSSTVAGKASSAALDSLKSTVTGHAALLLEKGNCQIFRTSYAGKGTCGANNACSLTFAHKPVLVFILRSNALSIFAQGMGSGFRVGSGNELATLTWSGNTVEWYSSTTTAQMNDYGSTYTVVALLDAAA